MAMLYKFKKDVS